MKSRTNQPALAPPRLAVVENDEELREKILVPALRLSGFDASGLANALQLYRMWAEAPFDLVLLDVGLPDEDGFDIARHLRGISPSTGIVMYTAHGRKVDRMRGLRAGVDAYLVKPLGVDEVVETLRNVDVRRTARDANDKSASRDWSLNRQGWALSSPSGAMVVLNQAERQVMSTLLASRCMSVPRGVLIETLASDAEAFDPHRLEMLIYRLRRKCFAASGEALPLRAVRGVGYVFEP